MNEIKRETVCGIVVTFNRKALLKECLNALIEQTSPLTAILIVDNASTDNTIEALLESGYIKELRARRTSDSCNSVFENNIKNSREKDIKIIYIQMNKNTGGAGGFYEGLKFAFKLGYEWLWLMDDDGKPDLFCLENILKYRAEDAVINSLVVDKNNHENLSFQILNPFTKELISKREEVDSCAVNGMITGQAHFFNGTFFHRDVVKKAGLPMREMFIWGDEVEYTERLRDLGYSLNTCASAIHYHPRARVLQRKIPIFGYNVNWQDNNLKNYCDIRNRAYINKKYFKKTLVISAIKYVVLFLMTRNFNDLKFWMGAYLDGVTEKWGGEMRFLK